jgi:hypothetical protein
MNERITSSEFLHGVYFYTKIKDRDKIITAKD